MYIKQNCTLRAGARSSGMLLMERQKEKKEKKRLDNGRERKKVKHPTASRL
jgi:hypothetical protein